MSMFGEQKQAGIAAQTEEELLLEQDIEDKTRHKQSRGLRLNYDEDSSDEDYEKELLKVEVAKPDHLESADDDMFASDNDEEQVPEAPGDADRPDADEIFELEEKDDKKPRLLNLDKFHKAMGLPEHDNGDSETVEDVETDDKVDYSYYNDPELAETGRKVPKVEPKIDAFNLKEEAGEGQFDELGNFVRDEQDLDEAKNKEKDSWYLEYSNKAEIAKTKKLQELRERQLREERKAHALVPLEELLKQMVLLLEPVETPMERLLALNKRNKKKKHWNGGKKGGKTDQGAQEAVLELERKHQIDEITSLASLLVLKGCTNVYDETREELMRLYKEETGQDMETRGAKRKAEEVEEPEQADETETGDFSPLYEFKYGGDDEIHGEYSRDEILAWKETYFDDEVMVRRVGDEVFVRITDF